MKWAASLLFGATLLADPVEIGWNKIVRDSKTTLRVVVNPPLRRGSPIHDRAYEEVRKLGADYVRYVPWLPYPRLAVAELEAAAGASAAVVDQRTAAGDRSHRNPGRRRGPSARIRGGGGDLFVRAGQ